MKNSKNRAEPDNVLVYSTDPTPIKNSSGVETSGPYALKPAVRIEKKGRGGKSVTVLFKLPPHETLLAALAAFLKKSFGTGGTSYLKNGEGFVEIQGEREETVLDLVKKFKWSPK